MANQRRLVISFPVEISGTTLYIKSSALDPQELRFALLFWDQLDFPTNNLVAVELDEHAKFLAARASLQERG